jgi:hypothetical protein
MAAKQLSMITAPSAPSHAPHGRTTHLAAIVVTALALLLSASLSGCGSGGGESEVDLQGAQTADDGGGQGATPTDGGDGDGGAIEPDEGGDGKVSIQVAALPFGGAAEPTGDLTQCVTAGLNGDLTVPEGAVLTISVGLSTDLFALDSDACAGIDGPWCDGLDVTGSPGACNIGVVATRAPTEGEAPPTTSMSGTLTCEAAAKEPCEQVQAELAGAVTTIQFALPAVPEPGGEITEPEGEPTEPVDETTG